MKQLKWLGLFIALALALAWGACAEEGALTISAGESATAQITFGGEAVFYSFVPQESGVYAFYSHDTELDSFGALYDADMRLIAYNDDDGVSNCFQIVYPLEAGETYHFSVSTYDSRRTGDIQVTLTALGANGMIAYGSRETYRVNYADGVTLQANAWAASGDITYQWYEIGEGDARTALTGQTRSYLTIPVATQSGRYLCRVQCGDQTEELSYTLEVRVIDLEATSETEVRAQIGDSVTFSVAPISAAGQVTYQWYRYTLGEEDGLWTNMRVPIDGATGDTLALESAASAGTYICEAEDETGLTDDVWFSLSIDNSLTAKPADGMEEFSVTSGEEFTMTVEASAATGGLSYTWYEVVDWVGDSDEFRARPLDVPGTASCTLTAGAENNDYLCRVCDDFGNYDTVWFYVRVEEGGTFELTPLTAQEQEIEQGEDAELSVAVTGDAQDVTYQWYIGYARDEDDEDDNSIRYRALPGATGSTYTARGLTRPAYYRVVATSGAESHQATFTLSIAEQERLSIVGGPWNDLEASEGDDITLSVALAGHTGEVRYQWFRMLRDEGSTAVPVLGATGPTLEIQDIQDEGETTYICNVSDDADIQRVTYRITVNGSLQVSGGDDLYVQQGESATLQCEAEGGNGAYTYQWIRLRLNEWDETYGATLVEGADGDTLTVSDIQEKAVYKCVVTDGQQARTAWFYVRIDSGFSAEAETSDLRVTMGESATLKVNAETVLGELRYQWYDDNYEPIPGADGDTYVTEPIEQPYTYFYCRVSDGYQQKEITFYIQGDSGLTAAAATETDLTVAPGSSVTLGVEASTNADELTYTWYRSEYDPETRSWSDYEIIPDAVEAEYTEPSVQGFYQYRCDTSDGYSTIGIYFAVSIETNFEASYTTNESFKVEPGSSVTMGVEASSSLNAISYTWSYATFDIQTQTWSEYTVIADATEDTYTAPSVYARTSYVCRVSNGWDSTELYFTVFMDSGLEAEYATNATFTIEPGTSVTLSVEATNNSGSITYRWSRITTYDPLTGSWGDWEEIDGASAPEYTTPSLASRALYRCTVSDGYDSIDRQFEIYIGNYLNVERIGPEIVLDAQDTVLQVEASCQSGSLTYQWRKNNVTISGADGPTLHMADETGSAKYTCAVADMYGNSSEIRFYCIYGDALPIAEGQTTASITADDVILLYAFTPEATAQYTLTSLSDNDTYGYLLSADGTILDSDDDGSDQGNNFRITRTLLAGQSCYWAVRYYSIDSVGEFDLSLTREASEIQEVDGGSIALRAGQAASTPRSSAASYRSYAPDAMSSDDEGVLTVLADTITAVDAGTTGLDVLYDDLLVHYTVTVYPAGTVLTLPDDMVEIGEEAFAGDAGVQFVEFGTSFTNVYDRAFAGSGVQQLLIPYDALFSSLALEGAAPTLLLGMNAYNAEIGAQNNSLTYLWLR